METFLNKRAQTLSKQKVYWGFILKNENTTAKETSRRGSIFISKGVIYQIFVGPINQHNSTQYGLLYTKNKSINKKKVEDIITIFCQLKNQFNDIYPLNESRKVYANKYINFIYMNKPVTKNICKPSIAVNIQF